MKFDYNELKELAEIKRKLGPMTRVQRDQAHEFSDAEIARSLVRLIELLEKRGAP
jgi:hypothetical protein